MVRALLRSPGGAVSDFIREVDEDLRRENLEKLWRRYGSYAVAAAVVIILGVAGYVGWQRYAAGQRAERAQQFQAALALATKPDVVAATQTLQAIATPPPAVIEASQ